MNTGSVPLLINGIHDIDILRYVTGLTIESLCCRSEDASKPSRRRRCFYYFDAGRKEQRLIILSLMAIFSMFLCINLNKNPKHYHYKEK
ncbi:hypothetical protein [Alteribacillus bidgolensis]|uniref:hypothetical protein n=1 Tax=Alteribacillus bidgolensis TaxID=930129 RepID=UPI00111392A8|nr:hypothetical protein [Alteribacillus bidgolensis]